MRTHTCTCQQTLRADTDTDTKKTHTQYTVLHTSLALLGSGIPWWQTVRLFLTIDLRSLLCKVWFHSGEYEMGPGEGSWLGQGGTPYSGASYLRVTLGILPWHSFQPLCCLEHPTLGFLNLPPQDWCIPAGHRAWVVAPALPPPVLWDWRKEKAEKCSEGLWPRGAQCERWWWRRGCDAYLPLTHTAVIAQRFTIWWSTPQPGEDASLTCHLDGTDKHRGWTDPALTPSMNTPSSSNKKQPRLFSEYSLHHNHYLLIIVDSFKRNSIHTLWE